MIHNKRLVDAHSNFRFTVSSTSLRFPTSRFVGRGP